MEIHYDEDYFKSELAKRLHYGESAMKYCTAIKALYKFKPYLFYPERVEDLIEGREKPTFFDFYYLDKFFGVSFQSKPARVGWSPELKRKAKELGYDI